MKSELRDCQKQELEDGKGKMKAEKTVFLRMYFVVRMSVSVLSLEKSR